MKCNSQVCEKHCIPIIDLDSLVKVELSLFVSLLLVVYVSKTPPCVIVSLICLNCFLVALFRLLEVFVINVLMAAQSVGIRKVNIQLDSPAE